MKAWKYFVNLYMKYLGSVRWNITLNFCVFFFISTSRAFLSFESKASPHLVSICSTGAVERAIKRYKFLNHTPHQQNRTFHVAASRSFQLQFGLKHVSFFSFLIKCGILICLLFIVCLKNFISRDDKERRQPESERETNIHKNIKSDKDIKSFATRKCVSFSRLNF